MQSSRLGESDPNRTDYKYENVSFYGQSFCHFGHFTQTFIKFMDPFCYAIHVDRGRYYYRTFFCRHTGQMVILLGNCLLISFPLSTIRQKKRVEIWSAHALPSTLRVRQNLPSRKCRRTKKNPNGMKDMHSSTQQRDKVRKQRLEQNHFDM